MIIFRNKTAVKVLIALFFSFFVLINIFAIEEKDYKNMTDRDRILLAVSYYEVSMKYEGLNNKALAQSYRKEALKIEKDVEKYFKGELEVPRKTIEIDWNSIFTSDSTADEQQEAVQEDEEDDEEYLEEDIDDEDLFADIDMDEDVSDDVFDESEQTAADDEDLFGDIYQSDNADNEADKDKDDTQDKNSDKSEEDGQKSDAPTESDNNDDNADKNVGDKQSQSDVTGDGSDKAAEENASGDTTNDEESLPQEEIVDLPAETLGDESASGEEADTEEWIAGEQNDLDPTIVISQIVRNLFTCINANDSKGASRDLADVVTYQMHNLTLSREEFEMTVKQWRATSDEPIPEYSDMIIEQLDENTYEVCVVFDSDFKFFIPLPNKKLLMEVKKIDNKYKIDCFKTEQPQQSDLNSSSQNKYLHNFVSAVLSNDFELVSSYIYQDVWINEYQMLFPAGEILDHLQNWYIDNVETTSPEQVVDFDSVQSEDETALEMIQTLGGNVEDFDIISFRLINNSFLPGDPEKDHFSIIVGNNGVAKDKILGIAQ